VHGYDTSSWPDALLVMKKIAKEHNWQYSHVPDARVLILIGLGNKNSDPSVLTIPPSILEPGLQAIVAARAAKP
jgi:hypothetical protein